METESPADVAQYSSSVLLLDLPRRHICSCRSCKEKKAKLDDKDVEGRKTGLDKEKAKAIAKHEAESAAQLESDRLRQTMQVENEREQEDKRKKLEEEFVKKETALREQLAQEKTEFEQEMNAEKAKFEQECENVVRHKLAKELDELEAKLHKDVTKKVEADLSVQRGREWAVLRDGIMNHPSERPAKMVYDDLVQQYRKLWESNEQTVAKSRKLLKQMYELSHYKTVFQGELQKALLPNNYQKLLTDKKYEDNGKVKVLDPRPFSEAEIRECPLPLSDDARAAASQAALSAVSATPDPAAPQVSAQAQVSADSTGSAKRPKGDSEAGPPDEADDEDGVKRLKLNDGGSVVAAASSSAAAGQEEKVAAEEHGGRGEVGAEEDDAGAGAQQARWHTAENGGDEEQAAAMEADGGGNDGADGAEAVEGVSGTAEPETSVDQNLSQEDAGNDAAANAEKENDVDAEMQQVEDEN